MTMQQGTQEWLTERNAGIGGSEAAVLYPDPSSPTGCHHPWLTPYKLWALKTGRLESVKSSPIDSPQLWWGTALEDDVRDAYQLVTGREVVDGATMTRHPSITCMIANTDGLIVGADDQPGDGVYEGKTTTIWNSAAWEGGVPLYYRVQTNWYMGILDLQWAGVGLYMGGARSPLKVFDVERHDRLIDDMCERAEKWWDRHVVRDTPPEVDGSTPTTETIASLFPREDAGSVQALGDGFGDIAAELANIRRWEKAIKTRKAALQNQIRAAIGDAEYGKRGDGSGWHYVLQERKGHVVKPSSSRVLRAIKDIDRHQSNSQETDMTPEQTAHRRAMAIARSIK